MVITPITYNLTPITRVIVESPVELKVIVIVPVIVFIVRIS